MHIPRRSILLGASTLPLATWLAGCRAGGGGPRNAGGSREPRFEGLADVSRTVAPIGATERIGRRARTGAWLSRAGVDAFVCEPGATMTWLTGVAWNRSERLFALVVLADGTHFWLVPAFEEARARERIDAPDGPGGAIVTWREDEYAIPRLAAELAQRRLERVAVEPSLRTSFTEDLAMLHGREQVVSGRAATIELRSVKDAHELELLARANAATQQAIAAVAATLEPGIESTEIAARLDAAHQQLGLHSPWCLALTGPAAALPHGTGNPTKLARGDVLLVDTGAALHGYQSDVTRTWVFDGEPTVEVERVWNSVRDAQRAALDAIRVGVEARSVDAAARAFLATRGFDGGYRDFTHRLGHGIGVEGHEDPYFDGGNRTMLASGMTLSVEPGLYFPGRFGVRIEDIVAVTGHEPTLFGSAQADVRSPA